LFINEYDGLIRDTEREKGEIFKEYGLIEKGKLKKLKIFLAFVLMFCYYYKAIRLKSDFG